jgi:hypothetical protein
VSAGVDRPPHDLIVEAVRETPTTGLSAPAGAGLPRRPRPSLAVVRRSLRHLAALKRLPPAERR